MAGGLLAGVAALAVWLSNLLPGWGWGTGGDNHSRNGARSGAMVNTQSDPSAEPEKRPNTDAQQQPSRVVVVRLVSDQILWQKQVGEGETGTFVPTSLSEVVNRAKQARGDERGVKVYVNIAANAVRRDELIAALRNAGLQETEIFEDPEYR